MYDVLEGIETFPGRLRRFAFWLWRVDRWRDHLHRRNVAWAIGEDGPGFDPHDELRTDGFAKQWICVAYPSAAVDAQLFGLSLMAINKSPIFGLTSKLPRLLNMPLPS